MIINFGGGLIMNLSKRIINMQSSPIRRLIPFADEAKKRGTEVLHLNIGQPDISTPDVFFKAIANFGKEVVPYSPSAGLMDLREAFSKYYKKWNASLASEEIMITNGGSEALIFALGVACDPDDEVFVVEPFYANYRSFAGLMNVKLNPITAKPENGYKMPAIEEFEEKLNDRTKAILFSNPCNPTGEVYSKEDVLGVLNFAKKHNLIVIVDEVYREFVFDGLVPFSAMEFEEFHDRVIVIDSVSKRYSACGARIGVFATKNKELFAEAMKMAQARLSPPTMAQIGTIGMLTLEDDYVSSVRDEYMKRRDIVYAELSQIEGISFEKPKGAFYVSVKLPVESSEDFVKWMLTDFSLDGTTVMVAPLDGFYGTPSAGTQEIRIAYVLKEEKLRKACRTFRLGLEEYNKK